MDKKNIVIVGGGVSGVAIALSLLKDKALLHFNFQIALIDPKDYFEFSPQILRAIADTNVIKNTLLDYKQLFSKYERLKLFTGFLLEKVEAKQNQILIKQVENEQVQSLSYDYLVLCVGSSYPSCIKAEWNESTVAKRHNTLVEMKTQIENAKSILILGGNSVGMEYIGEIFDIMKQQKGSEKKITLVHSSDRLLDKGPIAASNYSLKLLQQKGVHVLLNDKVVLNETVSGNDYQTVNGIKIEADLLLKCFGQVPNTAPLSNSPDLSTCINESGLLKVDNYLQVVGFNNIFAPGDINDTAVEKSAFAAKVQSSVVVNNLKSLLLQGKVSKQFKSVPFMQLVSIGKSNGVLYTKTKKLMSGKLASVMKSGMLKMTVPR